MESWARQVAWEQTYGRNRRKKIPMRGDPKPSAQYSDGNRSSVAGEDQKPQPDRWSGFQQITWFPSGEMQGVYGIVHRASDRAYVGSSVAIKDRLRSHLSDLRRQTHHSQKLQRAWDDTPNDFIVLLIEHVEELLDLRVREQHWIDNLEVYTRGFNSKSVAEGPEPSTLTHIDGAIKSLWPAIYSRFAPSPEDYPANDADRVGYATERKRTLAVKAKHAAIWAFIMWLSIDIEWLRISWLLGALALPFIAFSGWPDSPKQRAERRYREADAEARQHADEELIQVISGRLGVPEGRIRELYLRAPQMIVERDQLRERYRRDPWLRAKAQFNRRRRSGG
jgi:hypothetical protein